MVGYFCWNMPKKLILDIGNTNSKAAVFSDDDLVEVYKFRTGKKNKIPDELQQHGIFYSCIISSVVEPDKELLPELSPETRIIRLRSGLKLPVKINYRTPESLGSDRIANACGCWKMYPGQNVLVVDTGTCLKFDYVDDAGSYQGGSISPGLLMRFQSLNRFTSRLPFYEPNNQIPELTGQTTEGSIRSGVVNGMIAEINGIIQRYREVTDQLIVILTGGDHFQFEAMLKNPIFVAPNLTLTGLKVILDHND
jgi:type III pantothenate kinase